eukprot:6186240-Alexandrium_andersonii.AAC.1
MGGQRWGGGVRWRPQNTGMRSTCACVVHEYTSAPLWLPTLSRGTLCEEIETFNIAMGGMDKLYASSASR